MKFTHLLSKPYNLIQLKHIKIGQTSHLLKLREDAGLHIPLPQKILDNENNTQPYSTYTFQVWPDQPPFQYREGAGLHIPPPINISNKWKHIIIHESYPPPKQTTQPDST